MKMGRFSSLLYSGLIISRLFGSNILTEENMTFKGFTLNELIKVEKYEEEYPDYMHWMFNLKKKVDDIEEYINTFSNKISRKDEQVLRLDPNIPKKEVKFYIYKKMF